MQNVELAVKFRNVESLDLGDDSFVTCEINPSKLLQLTSLTRLGSLKIAQESIPDQSILMQVSRYAILANQHWTSSPAPSRLLEALILS